MTHRWTRWIGAVVVAMTVGMAVPLAAEAGEYAIILQAGKQHPEGLARALHALLYAKELKEHGHEVVLIFDGAGTTWAEEFSNPKSDSVYRPLYEELKQAGAISIVCDYCASAFKVKAQLVERKVALAGEYAGHPSIAKWVDAGYQLIIL